MFSVNGVVHNYYYVDGQLRYERNGDSYEIYYTYDADGRPVLATKRDLVAKKNYQYYLITNTRGDIIETRNGDGNVNAKFVYDAWGKLISVTNASGTPLASDSFAYQISLKYRGYVYDNETGLYYLQSRYYDPETGRFLNADDVDYIGASGTVLGYNAFAYCENNAVNDSDPNGLFSFKVYAVAAVTAALIGAFSKILNNYFNGIRGWKLFRGVVGASVGSSVNILLLMKYIRQGTKGMVLAAFVAGAVQSVIDFAENVLVDKTRRWGQLTYSFIFNSAAILAGNYLGGKCIFINKGWFQTQKISSFFVRSYGKRLIAQTGIGAVLSIVLDLIKNRLERKLTK